MSTKKRMLLELSDEQENAITKLAKRYKLNRVDILRLFCDLLIGEEDLIHIIIHTPSCVKYVSKHSGFREIIDPRNDNSVSNVRLIFEHSMNMKPKNLLGGDNDDS